MNVAMTPADAKACFGAAPPDLSVEARVRGSDWLYNYFLGFYRDDKSASGWNNLVFPNVACRTCCGELLGHGASWSRPNTRTTKRRWPAAIAAKGLAQLEPGKDGK